MNSLNNYLC